MTPDPVKSSVSVAPLQPSWLTEVLRRPTWGHCPLGRERC